MFLILSCNFPGGGDNDDEAGGRVNLGQVGSGDSTEHYVNPVVILVDSPDFTVTEGGLIHNPSPSELISYDYLWGVFFVDYTGTENLRSVAAAISYRNSDGEELYNSSSTYVWNDDGYVWTGTTGTQSYMTPLYNHGVLIPSFDLLDAGLNLADITTLEIEFSSWDAGTSPVVRDALTLGEITSDSENDYFVVTNTSDSTMRILGTYCLYTDEAGHLGYSAPPFIEVFEDGIWVSKGDFVVESDQQIRLKFMRIKPSYLSGGAELPFPSVGLYAAIQLIALLPRRSPARSRAFKN